MVGQYGFDVAFFNIAGVQFFKHLVKMYQPLVLVVDDERIAQVGFAPYYQIYFIALCYGQLLVVYVS